MHTDTSNIEKNEELVYNPIEKILKGISYELFSNFANSNKRIFQNSI